MHFALVEQHVDFSLEHDRVVDAARAMHGGVARIAVVPDAHLGEDGVARAGLAEISAGVSSVTHRRVETRPEAWRSFWFGAALSYSTTALPWRCPVTMRRTGFIPASRRLRAAPSHTCRSRAAGWPRSPPACRR